MFLTLLKLYLLKMVRSVSLSRKLVSSLVLLFIGFILLSNILVVGLSLDVIIQEVGGYQDVVGFINTYLIFFFLAELIYRFFLQKISPFDLQSYLHLPVGEFRIINFILLNSFISPLNIVGILLFAPIAMTKISVVYGITGSMYWLVTIVGLSWSIHWFMLWFKQKYGENIISIAILFGCYLISIGGLYWGWFNIGKWVAPFFEIALQSWFPLVLVIAAGFGLYMQAFWYYRNHAYIEELDQQRQNRLFGKSFSLFDGFGFAGTIADQELKLILRHKRPRTLLGLSPIFLLYGLIFYGDFNFSEGIPAITIFVGIFITGTFIMNYGQYFLSWNSAYFDFFTSKYKGIQALVTGKFLLFGIISAICFLLSIPYVYYGWQILLIHTATFIFNMGITIHFITYLALWKPKPIDINKGGLFNYEGMGMAQFLIIIPIAIVPYLIYLPFSWLLGDNVGLAVLAMTGIVGIIFYKQLIQLQVNRIRKKRYKIGTSFRQEL